MNGSLLKSSALQVSVSLRGAYAYVVCGVSVDVSVHGSREARLPARVRRAWGYDIYLLSSAVSVCDMTNRQPQRRYLLLTQKA